MHLCFCFIYEETLKKLLRQLIAPFGKTHPYSCLPPALTDTIGRPPLDWSYIRTLVDDLCKSWEAWLRGGPAKKKRRKKNPYLDEEEEEEDGKEEEQEPVRSRAVAAAAQRRVATFSAAAAQRRGATVSTTRQTDAGEMQDEEEEEEGDESMDEATFGHPRCTSAEDCIGSPLHPLVRHVHNGVDADIYCEPCWTSFSEQNLQLTGRPVKPGEV